MNIFILNQISKDVGRVLALPEINERLQAMGFVPAPTTSEELDRILRDVQRGVPLAELALSYGLGNDAAGALIAAIREVDAWARQQPETLAEMAARFVPLSDALDGLNGALYSETGQHWQGEDLWRAIGTLPRNEAGTSNTPQETSPLPPLYPR